MEQINAQARRGLKRTWVVLTALALVVATPGPGEAQRTQPEALLTAEGLGVIVKGNQARARDRAIVNGLRRCVEQVVGDLVDPELILNNYPLIAAELLDRAEDYIRRYRIFHEQPLPKSRLYRVAIQATVARARLKSDLQAMGLFLERRGKPTVMVLIEEVAAPDGGLPPEGNRSQRTFLDHLRGRGFPVVESPEATEAIAAQALAGSPQAAASLGQRAGVEVVLLGKTVVRRISPPAAESTPSYQATVSVRAVEVDEGRVVATGSDSAVALPGEAGRPETVIQEAAAKLASFMADQLLSHWRVEETQTTPIVLAVTGASIANLVEFKSGLRNNITGVQQMIQRRYSEEGALVEVGYTADASQLAEAIGQIRFGLFTVQVVGVGPQRIDVHILP
ncbi:MAG: DUF2066 domain-containing protein [bacterium]|nr:DUF2066 domain-containing protein [bacterium]